MPGLKEGKWKMLKCENQSMEIYVSVAVCCGLVAKEQLSPSDVRAGFSDVVVWEGYQDKTTLSVSLC